MLRSMKDKNITAMRMNLFISTKSHIKGLIYRWGWNTVVQLSGFWLLLIGDAGRVKANK